MGEGRDRRKGGHDHTPWLTRSAGVLVVRPRVYRGWRSQYSAASNRLEHRSSCSPWANSQARPSTQDGGRPLGNECTWMSCTSDRDRGGTVLVRVGRPAVLDNPVLRRNGTLWALRILVVCWGYDLDVSLATRLLQQSAQWLRYCSSIFRIFRCRRKKGTSSTSLADSAPLLMIQLRRDLADSTASLSAWRWQGSGAGVGRRGGLSGA